MEFDVLLSESKVATDRSKFFASHSLFIGPIGPKTLGKKTTQPFPERSKDPLGHANGGSLGITNWITKREMSGR